MMNQALLFAQSDFWMTRWLTPVWILGVGVTAGLILLGLFIALFAILSRVPGWNQLGRKGLPGHLVALIASVVMAGFLALSVRGYFVSESIHRSDEWAVVSIAIWLLSALFCWSIVFCSSSNLIGELKGTLFEGVGSYLLVSAILIAAIGLLASPIVDNPWRILASVPQVFSTGEKSQTILIDGAKVDNVSIGKASLDYDPRLLQTASISSDRNVIISDAEDISKFRMRPVRIEANIPYSWNRNQNTAPPLPTVAGTDVFVQNEEIDPAKVVIHWKTLPPVPEAATILIVALATLGFGLALLLQQGASPKVAAIAMATAKSEVSQPLFLLLVLLGLVLIILFVFLPFYTLGEDIKLLKDCGITVILVLSIFQGVWSASSSVSDEIEGRTALTVLSKPIGRRSFLIGKMLGVFWLLTFMFVILGVVLLVMVAYKPLYDFRESTQQPPPWTLCHLEMFRTVPGLAMALMQATTLSILSVAIATRVPQLANFAICFSIYLVGHLTESMVGVSQNAFPIVRFVAQLIATIFPDLEHFSMQAAIDAGSAVPIAYLSGVLIYAVLYSALALLIGLLLFEDRDLA